MTLLAYGVSRQTKYYLLGSMVFSYSTHIFIIPVIITSSSSELPSHLPAKLERSSCARGSVEESLGNLKEGISLYFEDEDAEIQCTRSFRSVLSEL